ncbi:MAG: phosphoribosylformylglycinamidine synthase subunit PurQ [Candidatus Zixiibacteriota bacterium]|nr:MAG: phosphoribosylformylglycinamidine synthase subunit PurQ [candidate division Zixibacteria bacterium]
MKVGIVIFPGSNCDYDAYQAFKMVDGVEVEYLWHGSDDLKSVDVVVLPGGFAHGDYLRAGSIARFSPIMKRVIEFAESGGFVIGICNGFQVLLESGLLPGALMKNINLRFVCREVILRVENANTAFTSGLKQGQLLRMPVAHGEGNYYADISTLSRMESESRVIFRYVDREGVVTAEANPNGSINGVAGIVSEKGNVLGMMPHPERAIEHILGSIDGGHIIRSFCMAKT